MSTKPHRNAYRSYEQFQYKSIITPSSLSRLYMILAHQLGLPAKSAKSTTVYMGCSTSSFSLKYSRWCF